MQTISSASSLKQPKLLQDGDGGHRIQPLFFDSNNNKQEQLPVPSLDKKQRKSSSHLFKLQPLYTPRPIHGPTTIESLLHYINDHKKRARTPPTFEDVDYLGYSAAENDDNDNLRFPRLEEDDADETHTSTTSTIATTTLTRPLPQINLKKRARVGVSCRSSHHFWSLENNN